MKPAEAVEPIVAFAKTHRLRIKRDECNDLNIIGRRGDIYDYGDGKHFSVTVMAGAKSWNAQRYALVDAGCRITQNGDAEGTALFEPADPRQVEVALKAIQAYRKWVMTDEQRAKNRKVLSDARKKLRKTASDFPDDPDIDPDPETRF